MKKGILILGLFLVGLFALGFVSAELNSSWVTKSDRQEAVQCENMENSGDNIYNITGEVCAKTRVIEYWDNNSNKVLFVHLAYYSEGFDLMKRYLSLAGSASSIKENVYTLEPAELFWVSDREYNVIGTQEGTRTENSNGVSYSYTASAKGDSSIFKENIQKYPPIKITFSNVTTPSENKCIDSDGGKNVLILGEASIEGQGSQGDYCDYSNGQNKIYEAYCVNPSSYSTQLMECPSSASYCNKGKCSVDKPHCTENDGGKNPFVLGTTFPSRIADHTGSTDYCQKTSTGEPMDKCFGSDCSLREFYCEKDYPDEFYSDIPCSSGCLEGICSQSNNSEEVNEITVIGRLVNQITNEPVKGAKLIGAYEFFPSEVVTDENGKFKFSVKSDFKIKEGPEAGNSSYSGYYSFYGACYDYSYLTISPSYFSKGVFDGKEVSGQFDGGHVDIGDLMIYPYASIEIKLDKPASFGVQYKYKNSEGYNGPGNRNFVREHGLSMALPLDYDVFIKFTNEAGEEFNSATYHVPLEAMCQQVELKYSKGRSKWTLNKNNEITNNQEKEETPFKITNPSECSGCILSDKCYPLGYRKSGKFCSEDVEFVEYKGTSASCDNSFECKSNLCIDDECISGGLFKSMMNWFKRFFTKD